MLALEHGFREAPRRGYLCTINYRVILCFTESVLSMSYRDANSLRLPSRFADRGWRLVFEFI